MFNRPFIIDVSRLVGRLMKGRLPTGVDRVMLAYISNYGERSLAFVRDGRFHLVFPHKLSQTLFHLLQHPPTDFKAHAWRLIAQGAAGKLRTQELSGSFFFNIGHSGLEYHRYPDLLQQMKVRPVFLVHDLIPITHPEYCRPGEKAKHQVRMNTVLRIAHGIVTNSQATLDELSSFAVKHQLDIPVAVPAFLSPPAHFTASQKAPLEHQYFVMLGTIEPRKNHLLMLQLWRQLVGQMGDQSPRLVIMGQRGWECENVVDLLERCEQLKGYIIELPVCTDTEIATWLTYAQALLFPSFSEGFGLPLVEALSCATPVIASNLPVFREIAGDIPDYCDPLDGLGWLSLIQEYSVAGSRRRSAQLDRIAQYVAPSWSGHFKCVDALLEKIAL